MSPRVPHESDRVVSDDSNLHEGGYSVVVVFAIEQRNWSALPADTPTRVRRLLERCLDRDVKTRLRDIGEARVALASPDRPDAAAAAAPQQHRRAMSIVPAAAIAIVAAIASALGVSYFRAPAATSPSPVVRLPFEAPNTVASEVGDPTISPDGKTMLFTGRGADGRKVLWAQALDSGEAKPLPDTDDAIEPFWSWDSKSIAFGAQGKLKRLDIGESRAKALTDAGRSNNGSWSRNGVIVFSPDYGALLFKVSSSGGERTQVVLSTPGSGGDRYPAFLPDGKHFLFFRNQGVFVGSLDATDAKHMLDMGPAVYAPPGWLLYVRNGIVVAHRFDTDRLELTGDAHPIAPAVSADTWARGARLSVSETGVLVMGHAPAYDYQLAWFDRKGRPAGTLGPVRPTRVAQLPRISPDGSRVVVQIRDTRALNQDLWLGDVASGSFDRLTTAPEQEQLPVWTADGTSVFASTSRNGVGGVYRFPIGGGQVDRVSRGTNFPMDASMDGWLYFTHRGESTRIDIWALRLDNGQPAKGATARVIVDSEFDDNAPQISPDGRWLAYQSDVTGTYEVYVRQMTDGRAGPAVKVTTGHGMTPRWSRDGGTLSFASAPQGHLSARMMSVSVTPVGDRLQLSAPTPLFNVRMLPKDTVARDYDIAPDGRFLVGTVVGGESRTAATVVLNWPAIVK